MHSPNSLLFGKTNRIAVMLVALFCVAPGCESSVDHGNPNSAVENADLDPSRQAAESKSLPESGESPESQKPTKTDPPGSMTLPDVPIPDSNDEPVGASREEGLMLPESAINESQPNSGYRLRLAPWAEIEQEITNSNTLIVVDLWSMSCQPCIRELPGLVRLNQMFNDQIRCITVDVDFDGRQSRPPDFYFESANRLLTEIGAEFDNYLCTDARDDVLNQLGIVSIPSVLIYSADGKLIKRFVDAGDTLGFTYDEDVIPFIRQRVG